MPSSKLIVNGPGKYEISTSLFHGDHSQRIVVKFTTQAEQNNGKKFDIIEPIYINQVEREDGSGESWNIDGRNPNGKVKIYYNTKNRNGIIYFLATC
jgi:hypothetical protein